MRVPSRGSSIVAQVAREQPELARPTIASAARMTSTAAIAVGRHARGVGALSSNWTSTSPASAALISRIRMSAARTFARASRSAGSPFDDGCDASSSSICRLTSTAVL